MMLMYTNTAKIFSCQQAQHVDNALGMHPFIFCFFSLSPLEGEHRITIDYEDGAVVFHADHAWLPHGAIAELVHNLPVRGEHPNAIVACRER